MLNKLFTILVFLFFAIPEIISATIPSCELKNQAVEDFIKKKAKELSGEEYCQYRLYSTMDDIDGDDQEDFIMVFTIEGIAGGSNDSVQFLAVWLSKQKSEGPLYLKVGERGERVIEGLTVENKTITLTTKEYQKSDPMCCPTKDGQLTVSLSNEKLVSHEGK
ncbi:MAG: hypothetical protein C5B54_06080 [Acidobacteria bacterium]|nr:MAG: hypothetical protein C5B54_06080 [Acidobacteriota bacterium]